MDLRKVSEIEEVIDFVFSPKDKQLAWEAMNASRKSTFVLAIGGDSILKLVIIEDMLAAGKTSGEIGLQVSQVGSNSTLHQVGLDFGLDSYLVLNQGQRGMQVSAKTMSCAIEAMLWAIYVSSGRTTAAPRAFMQKIGLWEGA